MRKEKISILGGGPVGSLLSLMLVKEGYSVSVYEKREDPRRKLTKEGKSINLALSHRGIHALKEAGVFDRLSEHLIPMEGRMMHSHAGNLTFQPYGTEGQAIYSISRARLSRILCDAAESAGVDFHFKHRCIGVNLSTNHIQLEHEGKITRKTSDLLFGADGAFSVLRNEFGRYSDFTSKINQLSHGYKELSLAPIAGQFALEPNYLHIWPRGAFMLIALPNPDKTFTCTLFLPFEGEESFESLNSDEKVRDFFMQNFLDVTKLMPDLLEQFDTNPTSNLNMVDCYPWHKKKSLIIGDAAHAIVPFYGQGMNAGFEDCRLLMDMVSGNDHDWDVIMSQFQKTRKKDTDAISHLALENFKEMSDKVSKEQFLKRKRVDARLHKAYPNVWMPLYSMVTFSDRPYSECVTIGSIQSQVLSKISNLDDPETVQLPPLIEMFNDLMLVDQQAYQ